ncbi:MAG: hypothetical protein ACREOQ_23225 [Gemmatimonadales bacterium]
MRMRNSSVLTIDLGSAYTKIAIREGWDAQASLVRGTSLGDGGPEENYIIPSVVARSRGEWITGIAAARQVPGPGVTIFRNWKAGLFTNGERSGGGEGSTSKTLEVDHDAARDVAAAFFGSLRAALPNAHRERDLMKLPVRVCVPRLSDGSSGEAAIRDVLQQTGWTDAEGRSVIYEPESNALGLISRGRNATWVPRMVSFQPWYGRSSHLQGMIGPPLSRIFRAMSGEFGLLVTDIGAFTTDFGYVRFDASFASDDWNRPHIVQESCRLGIRDLDREVIDSLPPEIQGVIKVVPPADWERAKPVLYRGSSAAIRNPNGGRVVLGEGEDAARVADAIQKFATRAWEAREAFVKTHVRGPLQGEALTGGGAMVPAIRKVLLDKIRQAGRRWIYDLSDRAQLAKELDDGRGHVNQRELEAAIRSSQELVRGGSAIGGCSVFFE